ncbi:uncharacterized protein [Halyomorpha halys]|uniref:uncharacterized protein n=1 Tax=Halyomorpha halys TaxID=286706 RepID=UPI0006D509A1|nr:uncharacterized protein LOC106679923 [Halyomorpha halys]
MSRIMQLIIFTLLNIRSIISVLVATNLQESVDLISTLETRSRREIQKTDIQEPVLQEVTGDKNEIQRTLKKTENQEINENSENYIIAPHSEGNTQKDYINVGTRMIEDDNDAAEVRKQEDKGPNSQDGEMQENEDGSVKRTFYYEERYARGNPYVVVDIPNDMSRLVHKPGGILVFLNKAFPLIFS